MTGISLSFLPALKFTSAADVYFLDSFSVD